MTRARVLLTRPEPGASHTAAMLAASGFAPVVLPLSQIRPLDASLPAGSFDFVAVTSANAVRHAAPALITALRDLPALAVGARSATALRDFGFTDVEDAGGTADVLVDRLLVRAGPQARIAYLCGRPRKPTLEARLRQARRSVEAIETYQAVRLDVDPVQRRALLSDGFDAALIYSAEGALALRALLDGWSASSWHGALFLCLSADVAQALPSGLQVGVADRPDEASLLACLDRLF